MAAKTPSPAYSVRARVRLADRPGTLGRLAVAIGEVGGNINALEGFEVKTAYLEEDVIIYCSGVEHQEQVRHAIDALGGVEIIEWEDRTFALHERGKIHVDSSVEIQGMDDLAMAYSPGVARVCTAIADAPALSHRYTIRKNTVAVVSDGTAVLGLGDIGPHAAMPVMEGKAQLFKRFGGVDAFPICLDTNDPDEIVAVVTALAPTFGGINLEDIAAPGAFDVEARLVEALDIPVFHDDQHGTAIVTVAGLENALRIVDKKHEDLKVVVAGVGAAGVAVSKMLMAAGVQNIIGVDRQGAVHTGRDGLNASKQWFAQNTNPERLAGTISDVIVGADAFIGLSGPDLLTVEDVQSMEDDPIVFAMANPDPEIRPELIQGSAAVIATGRSDFPNQINNVLAFPGIFRGALDAGAMTITEGMKLAAARAIADVVGEELHPRFIVPNAFDHRVAPAVAEAVRAAAIADGVCRR
ncbi:malate dehydrogenase (oxaloacetate-decarboxylating) [Austwickia chelonae]|uniref:Putative malic enzyme n=1 Tax=Austwickia chelonae NBRC 105200 TaxID=1184607 RepID=K6V9B2_9MICO|nr:NAD-dependent malic enzyme [Austwickia chelonae]GAB78828.1 putative malic enzyme [Austwickia chelonae NBRC 105200]SEV84935.1 malate dehydrogenase (oxaloacetate-decarboxylating) [Austwickia chelonae]